MILPRRTLLQLDQLMGVLNYIGFGTSHRLCNRFKRNFPNLREICRLSGLPKIIVILHC